MSGGHLDYVHRDLKNTAVRKIEEGEMIAEKGVDREEVEWDVDNAVEYLNDLGDLLKAYSWWKCGDTSEQSYREVEQKFVEKWE